MQQSFVRTSLRFVFRNAETGEVRSATSFALNPAARSIGLMEETGRTLAAPWQRWEAWDGAACLWHMTVDGDCRNGPRGS